MNLNNLFIIGTLLGVGLLTGCATVQEATSDSEEKLTNGIFLEPEERAVLPAGMELRPIFAAGLSVTKFLEGFKSMPYNDAVRFCTIAYGHLIKQSPCNGREPAQFRNGISEPKGSELLVSDMERAQIAVLTMTKTELTNGQYAALCDFVYNVGTGKLKNSTLLAVVNQRQFDRVPAQFRRWSKANGKVIKGLKTRREKEVDLFFYGLGVPRALPSAEEDLSPIDIREGEVQAK